MERLGWEANRDEIPKGPRKGSIGFFRRRQVRKIDMYILYNKLQLYVRTLSCICISMYQNCGARIKMVVLQYLFLSNTWFL